MLKHVKIVFKLSYYKAHSNYAMPMTIWRCTKHVFEKVETWNYTNMYTLIQPFNWLYRIKKTHTQPIIEKNWINLILLFAYAIQSWIMIESIMAKPYHAIHINPQDTPTAHRVAPKSYPPLSRKRRIIVVENRFSLSFACISIELQLRLYIDEHVKDGSRFELSHEVSPLNWEFVIIAERSI